MLTQRRIGQVQRQFSVLAGRRSRRTRSRPRHAVFDNAVLREAHRRALSSAELIDDAFDEIDCSPEVLLRLANQP